MKEARSRGVKFGVDFTRLIQDFLGHRNIQHTVKYTATNPHVLKSYGDKAQRFDELVAAF
jgi:site-specific recombinase XerD